MLNISQMEFINACIDHLFNFSDQIDQFRKEIKQINQALFNQVPKEHDFAQLHDIAHNPCAFLLRLDTQNVKKVSIAEVKTYLLNRLDQHIRDHATKLNIKAPLWSLAAVINHCISDTDKIEAFRTETKDAYGVLPLLPRQQLDSAFTFEQIEETPPPTEEPSSSDSSSEAPEDPEATLLDQYVSLQDRSINFIQVYISQNEVEQRINDTSTQEYSEDIKVAIKTQIADKPAERQYELELTIDPSKDIPYNKIQRRFIKQNLLTVWQLLINHLSDNQLISIKTAQQHELLDKGRLRYIFSVLNLASKKFYFEQLTSGKLKIDWLLDFDKKQRLTLAKPNIMEAIANHKLELDEASMLAPKAAALLSKAFYFKLFMDRQFSLDQIIHLKDVEINALLNPHYQRYIAHLNLAPHDFISENVNYLKLLKDPDYYQFIIENQIQPHDLENLLQIDCKFMLRPKIKAAILQKHLLLQDIVDLNEESILLIAKDKKLEQWFCQPNSAKNSNELQSLLLKDFSKKLLDEFKMQSTYEEPEDLLNELYALCNQFNIPHDRFLNRCAEMFLVYFQYKLYSKLQWALNSPELTALHTQLTDCQNQNRPHLETLAQLVHTVKTKQEAIDSSHIDDDNPRPVKRRKQNEASEISMRTKLARNLLNLSFFIANNNDPSDQHLEENQANPSMQLD